MKHSSSQHACPPPAGAESAHRADAGEPDGLPAPVRNGPTETASTKATPASPWPGVWLGLLGLTVLGSLLPSFRQEYWKGPNLYALQARAFLQGQLGLAEPQHDTAPVQGRHYVVNPPFPAVVLLPFAAVLPAEADGAVSTAVCLGLTAASWWALRRIWQRLGVDGTWQRWLALGLFAGTGYWFCLQVSHAMWFFAHIVAIACLLLALAEAVGRGRGWLVGLLWAGAFLSRQLMVYAGLLLSVLVWQAHGRRRGWHLAGFAASAGVMAALYLWFNWARFGHPLETGYGLLAQTDFLGWRQQNLGLFHPLYAPVNLIHLLLQGPHVEFDKPELLRHWHLNPFGTSLTFGSPFVLLALWGRWPSRWAHRALWVSVGLTALHMLCYHTTGWVQVNTYRYALDFVPLLVVLAGLGAGRVEAWVVKGLVGYSVALNALALFWIPFVGRAYEQYLPPR